LALLRCCQPPLPPSVLAPSHAERIAGFIVILLGVFIEEIVLGAVIKALRWGSGDELALTGRPSRKSSSPFLRLLRYKNAVLCREPAPVDKTVLSAQGARKEKEYQRGVCVN
jgi:hypothetical protein